MNNLNFSFLPERLCDYYSFKNSNFQIISYNFTIFYSRINTREYKRRKEKLISIISRFSSVNIVLHEGWIRL